MPVVPTLERVNDALPPIQLALQIPSGEFLPDLLRVSISGLHVHVETDSAVNVASVLSKLGIQAERHGTGATFHTRQLASFLAISESVNVVADGLTQPLVTLLNSTASFPSTVAVTADGDHLIATHKAFGGGATVALRPSLAGALRTSGIAFVGDAAAWQLLDRNCTIPSPHGTVALHPDGYLTVTTERPDDVTASNIRGLTQLSAGEFLVPANYADDLATNPNFAWSTAMVSAPPVTPDAAGIELADHLRTDLSEVIQNIAVAHAVVIDYMPGLGERILAMAAVSALNLLPCVVLTSPLRKDEWMRTSEMFGTQPSSALQQAPVQVLSFTDVHTGAKIGDPAAVIIDDLTDAVTHAHLPAVLQYLDARIPRIAIAGNWSLEVPRLLSAMHLVKPAEFPTVVDIESRYPADSARRAREHVDAFCVTRTSPHRMLRDSTSGL